MCVYVCHSFMNSFRFFLPPTRLFSKNFRSYYFTSPPSLFWTASFRFSRPNFLNLFLPRQSTFILDLPLSIPSCSFHSVVTPTVSFPPLLVTWSNHCIVWPLTLLLVPSAPFVVFPSSAPRRVIDGIPTRVFLYILLPNFRPAQCRSPSKPRDRTLESAS